MCTKLPNLVLVAQVVFLLKCGHKQTDRQTYTHTNTQTQRRHWSAYLLLGYRRRGNYYSWKKIYGHQTWGMLTAFQLNCGLQHQYFTETKLFPCTKTAPLAHKHS